MTDRLKPVPNHSKITDNFKKNLETDVFSHVEDPRWIFLNAPENRDKYYYVRRGGPNQITPAACVNCGPPPIDSILEPLGRFRSIEFIDTYRSNLRDNYRHYWIWFENSENISQRVNETDQLYYIDELPVIINNSPINKQKGGKKTKKYRKKYRKTRNKQKYKKVFL